MGEKLSKHRDLINVKLNLSTVAHMTCSQDLLTSLTSPSTVLLPLTAPLASVAFLRSAWMLGPQCLWSLHGAHFPRMSTVLP